MNIAGTANLRVKQSRRVLSDPSYTWFLTFNHHNHETPYHAQNTSVCLLKSIVQNDDFGRFFTSDMPRYDRYNNVDDCTHDWCTRSSLLPSPWVCHRCLIFLSIHRIIPGDSISLIPLYFYICLSSIFLWYFTSIPFPGTKSAFQLLKHFVSHCLFRLIKYPSVSLKKFHVVPIFTFICRCSIMNSNK